MRLQEATVSAFIGLQIMDWILLPLHLMGFCLCNTLGIWACDLNSPVDAGMILCHVAKFGA